MTDEFVTFTAEMNILDALMHGPEVRDVFRRLGLKCVDKTERGAQTDYCVAAEKENLSIAALYHEREVASILAELNALQVRPLTEAERDKGGR